MDNIIKKDIIPDLTYIKTHIAPFQSIGIGLTIFRSDSIDYDYNVFNDIRKNPISYKPSE